MDARIIIIQHLLGQQHHVLFNLVARFGQDRSDLHAADHLAHGTLGDGFYILRRIGHVEQKVWRILDSPEHREIHIDDIFIAGQHQAFLRHVLGAVGVAHV